METKNHSEWNSENEVTAANLFDIINDILQVSSPLCTPETDVTSSLTSPRLSKTNGEDRPVNCDVKYLCTLFFQEHNNLQLFDMELWKIEMHAIFEAIVKCNYNCAEAARKLGLSKKTISTKIKMHRRRFGQMIRLKLAEKKRAASHLDTTPKE